VNDKQPPMLTFKQFLSEGDPLEDGGIEMWFRARIDDNQRHAEIYDAIKSGKIVHERLGPH
jgi:hypothetical protein